MRYIWLETKLYKKYTIVILLTSIILPMLNNAFFLKNGYLNNVTLSDEALLTIFGSSDIFYINWIYWIFFCSGYLILFQLIWRPNIHSFEVNQLLRHQSIIRYWMNKYLTGFLFSFIYIFLTLTMTAFTFIFIGITIKVDMIWFITFIFLTFNFYLHALIWLATKMIFSIEVANVLVMALFYAGVRIAKPYIPLYYGMVAKFNNFQSIALILTAELCVIIILSFLIIQLGRKTDYL